MLRLDISWLVQYKNKSSIAAFLGQHGFSKREARTLAHGNKVLLLRDTVVERLCMALVCTPNDLFRWHGDKSSHLVALNHSAMQHPAELFGQLGQAEVERLLQELDARKITGEKPPVQGNGQLKLNVGLLVQQRQQRYPTAYLKTKGFTQMEARKLLSSDRKAVKVKMLHRLCTAFTCLPNDLYDWDGAEAHHLNVLRKPSPPDLNRLLSGLSPEKVQAVLALLKQKGL